MRFMVLIRSNAAIESGVMPSEQALAEMGRFNEELVNAGVMRGGDGLHPSSNSVRVKFSGAQRTVVEGPFDARELIAGYWLWQVQSRDEAIAWIRRVPNVDGQDFEIELRQVFEAEDFGDALTPELRANEERLRERVAQA